MQIARRVRNAVEKEWGRAGNRGEQKREDVAEYLHFEPMPRLQLTTLPAPSAHAQGAGIDVQIFGAGAYSALVA